MTITVKISWYIHPNTSSSSCKHFESWFAFLNIQALIELIFVCEPSTLHIKTEVAGGSKWKELEALANLLERGVITEEEFETEKGKIMGSD